MAAFVSSSSIYVKAKANVNASSFIHHPSPPHRGRCVAATVTRSTLSAKKPTPTPKLAAAGDCLHTTPSQITLVSTHFSLCAIILGRAIFSTGLHALPLHAAILFTAYVFADFAVGLYHHAVDNYGSKSTPIFGCTFFHLI